MVIRKKIFETISPTLAPYGVFDPKNQLYKPIVRFLEIGEDILRRLGNFTKVWIAYIYQDKYIPVPSKGCQMVPKQNQFTIP